MGKVVVADTGPLIALAFVKLLPPLPEMFTTVYVPAGVVREATQDDSKPGAREIRLALDNGWLVQRSVKISDVYLDVMDFLDQGEAEALTLAEQLNAVALIDERRGRKVAAKQGISVTGTAAVLILAKQSGEVALIRPLLDTLVQSGYRLSPSLVKEVLRIAGE